MIKELLPWQLKIVFKMILARLPANYRLWQKFNLFRHGSMDVPEYAYRVFRTHFDRCEFAGKTCGFTGLEIGPGDSLFSCVIARALGASSTLLVDAGPFAKEDMVSYEAMASYLRGQGLEVFVPEGGLKEVLADCGGIYETEGLASLKKFPSDSVDFVWSHAVLEHIRKEEFLSYMRELHRVMKADGIGSHRVDLRDHLGGALNNLRFPESWWESSFMANSGFYTNRIRFPQMIGLFEQAGFSVKILNIECWERLPTPIKKIAPDFSRLGEEALLKSGFDVVLRPIK